MQNGFQKILIFGFSIKTVSQKLLTQSLYMWSKLLCRSIPNFVHSEGGFIKTKVLLLLPFAASFSFSLPRNSSSISTAKSKKKKKILLVFSRKKSGVGRLLTFWTLYSAPPVSLFGSFGQVLREFAIFAVCNF